MRVSYTLTASALVLSVGLTSCANTGNLGNVGGFCDENTVVCVLAAAVVVGGIIWAVSDRGNGENSTSTTSTSGVMSDMRLKRDVREAGMLPNGVKLYAFRYWNDERTFIGPSAQDLLQDERFRSAVQKTEKGYYLVNYAAIGGRISGDRLQYEQASRKALEAASPAL
jgi:hypothetical protein